MLLPRLDQHVLLVTVVIFVLVFCIVVNENELHEVPEVDALVPGSHLAYPVEEVVALNLSIGYLLDQYVLL